MSSSNNTVPPDVAARQHLDRIIQEGQARRGRRFNLPDLHAFFHKRFVERRRPAEEEYDPDVASSSAQDSQEADILEGADTPEFSLFGHIYPDIPDSDSDSSTGEYYMAELPHEVAPGEFTPVQPNTEPTDVGPAAQGTAGSDPTSVPTTTEASVVDNSTASIPASDSTEWLLFDLGPEEPLDPSNPEGYDSDWEKMVIDVNTSANQGAVSTDYQGTTVSLRSLEHTRVFLLLSSLLSLTSLIRRLLSAPTSPWRDKPSATQNLISRPVNLSLNTASHLRVTLPWPTKRSNKLTPTHSPRSLKKASAPKRCHIDTPSWFPWRPAVLILLTPLFPMSTPSSVLSRAHLPGPELLFVLATLLASFRPVTLPPVPATRLRAPRAIPPP